ncbi:MAG: TonB-dependent receptor, partial [Chitinophagaceae bacterium]
MKYYLFSTVFALTVFEVSGQVQNMSGSRQKVRVYGKIIEAATKKRLEAVSVQLSIQTIDARSGSTKDSVIAGMFSKVNGDFNFDIIVLRDSIKIVVSAVGYKRIEQAVAIRSAALSGTGMAVIDLGNLKMESESAQVLANVTVVASRPALELGIDRRVFNVDKNITSPGGTAIDVMKNIPSVSVDVEGNVQLRNASPQIFVDGRPTILTLDQIPADNIEKIELITNPSAK